MYVYTCIHLRSLRLILHRYIYRVYMRKPDATAFEKVFEGKEPLEYIAKGLIPNTEYAFKVMSFTANRPDGPFSALVTIRTAVSVSSATPADLRLTHASMDSIDIAWTLPVLCLPFTYFFFIPSFTRYS